MILRSLYLNLVAGTRLALFRPVRPFDFRVSAADYTALVVFNFGLWVLAAAARAGFEGEFDSAAATIYLATIPLVLAAGLVVGLIYGAPQKLLAIAVALSASDAFYELVALAIPYIGATVGLGAALYAVFFSWLWLVSIRAVAVVAGRERPQIYQASVVVSAMIAIAFFVFPRAEVWQLPPEAEPRSPLADERIFHRQGELIERALAAIGKSEPGKPELYFVGFAPDASQEVFLKEMRYVAKLFENKYRTQGRSIVLASSQEALEEFPIGSVTNLARVLKRVGEQMNPEEDVLFLFVTAHGDERHRLSASQPPIEMTPLTPTALARMLQDAGIKWRVVVVSACYSGGFVEPLRDENTLVMTAAAPDRTSFGCEAGRDFTYFGQAFFRDGLARTKSFIAAFDAAKEIVAKQEAAEKLTPSQPQIAAGKAIAGQLDKLP
jgi:hypothetical protein